MANASPFSNLFVYLYILVITPWVLINFTFDILLCVLPWTRPTREWSPNQAVRIRVVALLLRYWSLAQYGDNVALRAGPEGNRFEVVHPRSSKLYVNILADAGIQPGLLGMTWTPSKPPSPESVRSDMVVALHFHGGAFVIGSGRDKDTGYLARTLIRHMGCTHVCTPQYRLASGKGGRFPAPLQDALTAYLCLLREKRIPAAQIVLSGDSAGGNIALGLLRYIQNHGKELEIPLPGAVTLWSPWVDVWGSLHQDVRLSPNYSTDYLNGDFSRWGASAITGFGAVDPLSPYLSPLHHPFSLEASIPVFFHAGQGEILLGDIEAFCQSYKMVGWKIELGISKACPHDVLLLGSRIEMTKAAEEAARNARRFLSSAIHLGAD